MFLPLVQRRNPDLIDCAIDLHRTGQIPPDTYVIDLDTVTANASAIASAARKAGLTPWFVVKQIGRNPVVAKAIAGHIPSAAAIDVREAVGLVRAGVALGNVGHLVQIPTRDLGRVLEHRPEFVTVYDIENLDAVAHAARDAGIIQRILLRIAGEPDEVYPGQEGGFEPDDVLAAVETAAHLESVQIAGVTGFPTVLHVPGTGPNVTRTGYRVVSAGETLRHVGIDPIVDMPSHSCITIMDQLAGLGATHIEPGHALVGTVPLAVEADLVERPAYVYISEIAQNSPRRTAIFGGGFYSRGHALNALIDVGCDDGRRCTVPATIEPLPSENIDYYRTLHLAADASCRVGDTVVMAFRTQIFVTRSLVAVVQGLASHSPVLVGLWDSQGHQVDDHGGTL